MNLSCFLAERIGGKSGAAGRLGSTGTVVSIVPVALSVAVIIVAVAVSGGFRKEIREKARGLGGDIVLAEPGKDIMSGGSSVNASLSYKGKIEELPFVERMSGVSYKYGIFKTDNEVEGVLLKGIDSTYNTAFYEGSLREGSVPDFSGKGVSNEIMLSGYIADILNYGVGDNVTAYFVGDEVKVRRFRVAGIFTPQLEQIDKHLAIVDARHVGRLEGWDNAVSGYEIFLSGGADDDAVEAVEDVIYRYSADGDSPVSAIAIEDKYYLFFDWLHLLDVNVLIILALMIAVAGFNMVSGVLIMLFEKISHIGLLKAMGMTNSAVAKVFLTKAAVVVLKGMLWGNAIAVAVCAVQEKWKVISLNPDNYFVRYVPVDLDIVWILAMNAIAFAAIMTILLLPCLFIASVSPAETMRVK